MKLLFAGLILATVLTANAGAQVLRPIDQNRIADANGKIVDTSTLDLGTLPLPMHHEPVSPLSNHLREPARIVETKRVDTQTLKYGTVPTTILPQQNFAAKRAIVPGNLPAPPTVRTGKADIEKRVIRPLTPAGLEELKQELNTPH